MKRHQKFYTAALAVAFVLCTAFGSVRPKVNFSGKWVLDLTKTDFGNLPHNWVYRQILVTQDSGAITIENLISRPGAKDSTSTEKLNFDGQVSEKAIPNPKGTEIRSTTAETSVDGASLIVTKIYALNQSGSTGKIKDTETWSLSEDGKELMITKRITNATAEIKAVYKKM